MTQRKGFLSLGAFLYPSGHHIAAWRHPEAKADAGIDFRHYIELAQAAEAAKFDLIFLADGVGTRTATRRSSNPSPFFRRWPR